MVIRLRRCRRLSACFSTCINTGINTCISTCINTLLAVCLLVLPVQAQAQQTAAPPESQLRAAVISGILQYTQWQVPVDGTLCVLGNPPSGTTLLQAAARIRINKQPVTIQTPVALADISRCQVVVIGTLNDSLSRELDSQLQAPALLSICDACDTERVQADIELVVQHNRVGFNLRRKPADNTAIHYRAALLELANSIYPAGSQTRAQP